MKVLERKEKEKFKMRETRQIKWKKDEKATKMAKLSSG